MGAAEVETKPQLIASPAQLRKNMRLYIFTRVFQKRVFLPLAAIYFTTQAGISLQGIGILGGLFSLMQIIAELPTGMFADHFGKTVSLRIGSALNVIASTLYVIAPFPIGIGVGVCLEAIGYSFFGGASEAILHDTLEAQGRAKDYTKIHSRIQAAALLINAALVAAVPLTYRIDPRLPFAIGAALYAVLFVVNCNIKEVYAGSRSTERQHLRQRIAGLRLFKRLAPFFLALGFISAMYTAPSDFVNLQLTDLGIAPYRLGYVFAAASLVGVLIGLFVHRLKALSLKQYLLFDVAVVVCFLAALWSNWLPLIVITFMLAMGFWRYRRILYQAHMLEELPVRQKATLFSAINLGAQLFEFSVPIVFGVLVARSSIPHAFGYASLAALLAAVPLLIQVRKLQQAKQLAKI